MHSARFEISALIRAGITLARVKARVGRMTRSHGLFLAVVVFPTCTAVGYFGFIAHDVYVSESHFVVRDQQHQTASGLGSLLQGAGLSEGHDEAYSVQDFLSSRDALTMLDKRFHLARSYGRADIDWPSRFPGLDGDDSFEALLLYYRKHIVVTDFDATASILTLTVRAFTAEDAYRIDAALLEMSEDFVNRLNQRARTDLMTFAVADVGAAEKDAKAAVHAVSSYRNESSVFDPEKQSALQLAQIGRLQEELIDTRNRIADLRSVAANNPQLPVLQSRVRILQDAIDAETAKVAGGRQSLSSKSAEYESIELQRDYADKRLEIALTSLQEARENAMKQQLYVEGIAQPNQPDIAIEPKRIRDIAATFLLCLVIWGVLSLLVTAVKEHAE
jgi:capsular polysaccharide transport system permease protein